MKLFIPVICYNHTAHTSFMFSLMSLILSLKHHNIPTVLYPITFESLISRARNAAIAHFMSDPETTHILFIDSDIEFKVEDVFALLAANKEVVCAGYAQKWLNEDIMKSVFASHIQNPLELCTRTSIHLLPFDKPAELMRAEYATTGFLLIKRNVIEKLMTLHPELAYRNDIDGYHNANVSYFYNLFPTNINTTTKRYESEDYGFSRLWTEAGGEIYVATNVSLKHYGWYGFSANLYRHLQLMI